MDGKISCNVRIRGPETQSKEIATLIEAFPILSGLSPREESRDEEYDIRFTFETNDWKGLCSALMETDIMPDVTLDLHAKGTEVWKIDMWTGVFLARKGDPSLSKNSMYFKYIDEPSDSIDL